MGKLKFFYCLIKMCETDLISKFRESFTNLFANCEKWNTLSKSWDRNSESLLNFLEQMQSCEDLEPDVVDSDPLLNGFPDLKEKLILELTIESEQVVEKMSDTQKNFQFICSKLDSDYDVLERLYFETCRQSGGVEFVCTATATQPSFTFMLSQLKDIVDSASKEAHRQEVVLEDLMCGQPGLLIEKFRKCLPIKRKLTSRTKQLTFYLQYFMKDN